MPADSRSDLCSHCHRMTTFTLGESTGLWFCSRCGRPAPPPMSREEAMGIIKRVSDIERAPEGAVANTTRQG